MVASLFLLITIALGALYFNLRTLGMILFFVMLGVGLILIFHAAESSPLKINW